MGKRPICPWHAHDYFTRSSMPAYIPLVGRGEKSATQAHRECVCGALAGCPGALHGAAAHATLNLGGRIHGLILLIVPIVEHSWAAHRKAKSDDTITT